MMGALLIASPWIFGFAEDGGMKMWVPLILGMSVILYSLMTDYELGMSDNISMRTHLTLDLMSGILLAASPWIFGFADVVSTPHLVLGLAEVGAALMTRTHPVTETTKHRRERSFMDTTRSHRTAAHG
jgi:hypothetical protein